MTRCLVSCALVVPLLAGALTIAAAQPAAPRPAPSPTPAPVVNFTVPDSMKVSIRDPVPVSLPKKWFPDAAWGVIGSLVGLGGVVLGARLGEGQRRRRKRRRIAELKAALREECRSLLKQVAQHIDLCEQMIASLKTQRVLPGSAVRGIRTIYDATISELAPHLTVEQRNLLHVVHERMRIGDELIAAHLDDIRAEVRAGDVADPWAVAISQFEDQVKSYRTVERLLKSFLNEKPNDVEDVFYVQRPDDEPPVFERRSASAAIVPRTFEVARHFLRIVRKARGGLHAFQAKIGADHAALGVSGLRPDLQSLHDAIEEFKKSEARVIELRQPDLEAKLSRAFKDVEREYNQLDRHITSYEQRPEVPLDDPLSTQAFRILAESARGHLFALDSLIADLEKLTK